MIPGITDRRRLPRLGKVRLGEMAEGKRGPYPSATDHFIFDEQVPELLKHFGDNCTEIPIIFPSDDEDVFFPTARASYKRSGLFCKCDDGETAKRIWVPPTKDSKGDTHGAEFVKQTGLDLEDGEMFELPCQGEHCPYMQAKQCKNLGRLLFMVPDVPRLGVYEIATTSYNSITNVLAIVRWVRDMVGTVAGVPFFLLLKPQQVQPDGKAKTVYVLNLEFRGSLVDLKRAGAALSASPGALGLIGVGDKAPDDLYANGGADLDAELGSGDTVQQPRRRSKANASAVEPEEPPIPFDTEDTGRPFEDKPQTTETVDGRPVLEARITQVEMIDQKPLGVVWKLVTADDSFMTTDSEIASTAQEALRKGDKIGIVYEITAGGTKRALDILEWEELKT